MQLAGIVAADYVTVPLEDDPLLEEIASEEQLLAFIARLEEQMREAAKKFEFERAAKLRDHVRALRQRELTEVPDFVAEPSKESATK
jgi:excinuclease ABC subunit B